MTASQVKKIRECSCRFISEKFCPDIQKVYSEAGFCDVTIKRIKTTEGDQDPLIIEVYYPGVTETSEYLNPRVLIEIGSSSLREPFTKRSFYSFVSS